MPLNCECTDLVALELKSRDWVCLQETSMCSVLSRRDGEQSYGRGRDQLAETLLNRRRVWIHVKVLFCDL